MKNIFLFSKKRKQEQSLGSFHHYNSIFIHLPMSSFIKHLPTSFYESHSEQLPLSILSLGYRVSRDDEINKYLFKYSKEKCLVMLKIFLKFHLFFWSKSACWFDSHPLQDSWVLSCNFITTKGLGNAFTPGFKMQSRIPWFQKHFRGQHKHSMHVNRCVV